MKHTLIFIWLFIGGFASAQTAHTFGLSVTGQYFFDHRKFGFEPIYASKLRLPGLNYACSFGKDQKHRITASYEFIHLIYFFKDVQGDLFYRKSHLFELMYGYDIYRWHNFNFRAKTGLVVRKGVDSWFNYRVSIPGFHEVAFDGSVYSQMGTELGVELEYTLFSQLILSAKSGYIKFFAGDYTNLLQLGFGVAYKF